MRHYETTCVLRPNLGEGGFTEVIDRTIGSITEQFGGAVVELERIGARRLAYPIKKETQGYYFYLNYAAPPEAVAELERVFRIDDRILRYLTVKLADSIDEAGMEAERERLAKVRAARAARDAAAAEEEARQRSRRRDGGGAAASAADIEDQDSDEDQDDQDLDDNDTDETAPDDAQ